jgi:hypothetical protein
MVSPADALWAAQRTVQMHREPPSRNRATGRCAQCRPDGTCPQLAWATKVLAATVDPT